MAKIKSRSSDSHKTRPRGVTKHSFERVYWPYLPMVLLISFLLVIGAQGGGLKAAARHPFGKVLDYATSMSVGGLLADTNAERAASGVAGLKLNSKLDAAAQAQADDMAARNYWSHNTPEGSPPWTWVIDQGYDYQELGQNLAAGFSDEQDTVDGWMASPPHRENLLNPDYTQVGFGYAENADYTSAGGGPMTIVVAFYGEPQVLSESTTNTSHAGSSVAAAAATNTPAGSSSSAAPAASRKAVSTKKAAAQRARPRAIETAAPPVLRTTETAPAATSHIQLAAPGFAYGRLATTAALLAGLSLILFWAIRHLRAIRRFFLQGEAYAVRHPLTDLGLVVIAALLLLVSQSTGFIQ